jgi:predicted DNA-binding transcriptional regulator YafY
VSYSIPEALALILAAQVGRQFAGIPQHDLSSAVARLSSVIPDELRSMVTRVASGAQTEHDSHREWTLAECSRAIAAQQSVDIVYAAASRAGEETSRRVDPYAVFPYVRSWHVVGYCHLREDVRIFKVDRIKSVRQTEHSYSPRDDFDLAAFLSSGWGIIRGLDVTVDDVVLVFKPPSSRWVAEERWHSTQRVERRSDGSIVFRVRIQVTPEFQRWVFRYGRDVEVVAPEHLRKWVIDEAQAVITASSSVPQLPYDVA